MFFCPPMQLCVCQFHVWLAFDMQGVLVYVGISSALNFFIATVIFVAISGCVHYLTRSIVLAIFPV